MKQALLRRVITNWFHHSFLPAEVAQLERMCSLDPRPCRLTETILKSKMVNYSLPEDDWSSGKRISGRGLYIAVSIQLVYTRRLRCRCWDVSGLSD